MRLKGGVSTYTYYKNLSKLPIPLYFTILQILSNLMESRQRFTPHQNRCYGKQVNVAFLAAFH